jgi:signal transduction histidine kinase
MEPTMDGDTDAPDEGSEPDATSSEPASTDALAADYQAIRQAEADREADLASLAGPRGDDHEGLLSRLSKLADSTDGASRTSAVAGLVQIDLVASFQPAILAIRWATTAVSVALAAPSFSTPPDWSIIGWCGVIVAYTVLRTIRPFRYTGDLRSVILVIGEVALHTLAVGMTGLWDSPFVFSLCTAVIVAGFARGFGFAIRIAVVSSLLVSIPFLRDADFDAEAVRLSAQWSVSLLVVGLVAGYARRISGEADRQHSLALDRLGRLADANALLFSLHRVTQTLPASLDLDDVLDTTVGRLKSLFPVDVVVVLALDDVESGWEVLRREGVRLSDRLDSVELPPPLHRAAQEEVVLAVDSLDSDEGPGFSGRSGSGMYAVLPARGAVIGLLAIEAKSSTPYTARDLELFRGFVEPVALAIDNARWFSRLRTVGADEERTRIARDLHDRIGQSLAYLAFEIDRLVDRTGAGDEIAAGLEQLRRDIRGVIGEVRDTLYDLRTDVTEECGIADVIEAFAQRVRERSDLDVEVRCDRSRLPLLQEREMWRVAQEAITNVERHAGASQIVIKWLCNGESALLDIADDGEGLPHGRAGRMDSYGILGMKERASSIGAQFEIGPVEGGGTRVRCQLVRR